MLVLAGESALVSWWALQGWGTPKCHGPIWTGRRRYLAWWDGHGAPASNTAQECAASRHGDRVPPDSPGAFPIIWLGPKRFEMCLRMGVCLWRSIDR